MENCPEFFDSGGCGVQVPSDEVWWGSHTGNPRPPATGVICNLPSTGSLKWADIAAAGRGVLVDTLELHLPGLALTWFPSRGNTFLQISHRICTMLSSQSVSSHCSSELPLQSSLYLWSPQWCCGNSNVFPGSVCKCYSFGPSAGGGISFLTVVPTKISMRW